eukprot:CAMPEP_0172910338 /NCGR_PEP_ID=MMETSP1075-20121228/184453_1 /TAXON_ID=2916 /ORGANISM="Ceratium fusus, Strain PA161109" /LENGTH=253 /DNA_ID=CAMNT_0013768453 /DNA_START=17 /DNA_END=775 /DNA_ORIENTATION=+
MGGKCCTDRKPERPVQATSARAASSPQGSAGGPLSEASFEADSVSSKLSRDDVNCLIKESFLAASHTDQPCETNGGGKAEVATDHSQARVHWRHAVNHIKVASNLASGRCFSAEAVMGSEAVTDAVDDHFEELMASWVPRSAKGGAAVRVVEDGQRDGQLQAIEADGAVLRQPHGNQRAIADLDARRARVDTCPPPTQQEVPAEQAADVHVEEIKLARQRMDEMLARAEARTAEASTKIQASFRGNKTRKDLQ